MALTSWYCYRAEDGCRADFVTEANLVVALVPLPSTKAKHCDGGAFLSDKFGAEALPYLGDGG